jgi:hypothetical protein
MGPVCQVLGHLANVTVARAMSVAVKVCGCRPHEGVAAYTAGPAFANLQGREPREMWQGQASDAMGISARAVCCQGALKLVWEAVEGVTKLFGRLRTALPASRSAERGLNWLSWVVRERA